MKKTQSEINFSKGEGHLAHIAYLREIALKNARGERDRIKTNLILDNLIRDLRAVSNIEHNDTGTSILASIYASAVRHAEIVFKDNYEVYRFVRGCMKAIYNLHRGDYHFNFVVRNGLAEFEKIERGEECWVVGTIGGFKSKIRAIYLGPGKHNETSRVLINGEPHTIAHMYLSRINGVRFF